MRKNRITKSCQQCEAEYSVCLSLRDKSKFCSVKCRGLNQRTANRGENNANFRGGKSACVDCEKTLNYRYSQKLTPRCRTCDYKYRVAERSSNWKGGKGNPECVNCSAKTGDLNSVLCRNCYKGAMHPFWNGGTSTLQTLVRAMPENRQWIKQCMYRDRYTCQECDTPSTGNNLQVHHKTQFALILRENAIDSVEKARSCSALWDMDNGVTLCRSCHKLTESFNRKIN